MSSVFRRCDSSFQERRRKLVQRVRKLLAQRTSGDRALQQVSDCQGMLEGLPLAADEFALARGRIRNAHRYLESNEWGAARYELRLLVGALREPSIQRRFPRKEIQ